MNERALSEIVGYTLLFGMMILSVSALTVVGTSTLDGYQEREQVANAEAAFDILAENVGEHATERAVGRATEIRVADATVYFGQREAINVSVEGSTDEDVFAPDPLVYETDHGPRLVYSNGALFREEGGHSRMIREPAFRIDENRTILPLIEIRGTDDRLNIAGSRTVHVRTEQRSPRLYQHDDGDHEVEIEIVTGPARAEAWERYLESFDELEEDDCTVDDGPDEMATVSCDFETDEVYVPVTRLDGEID